MTTTYGPTTERLAERFLADTVRRMHRGRLSQRRAMALANDLRADVRDAALQTVKTEIDVLAGAGCPEADDHPRVIARAWHRRNWLLTAAAVLASQALWDAADDLYEVLPADPDVPKFDRPWKTDPAGWAIECARISREWAAEERWERRLERRRTTAARWAARRASRQTS
jgi:hypothetical protein